MKHPFTAKEVRRAVFDLREISEGCEFLAEFHDVVRPFLKLDFAYRDQAAVLLLALVEGKLLGTLHDETEQKGGAK